MKKVLILDDRIERKKTHMSSSALQKLLECVNDNYLAIVSGEDVKKESISKYFADYDLLAIHYSWANDKSLIQDIDDFAKSNNKLLIFFSGGIAQTLLLDDFKRLSINSAEFYSDKLPEFIEVYATKEIDLPLLHFLYGNNKNLALFMKYRQMVWKDSKENGTDEFYFNYESYLEPIIKASSSETLDELNKVIYNEIIKLKSL